jgi:hypothetical protein
LTAASAREASERLLGLLAEEGDDGSHLRLVAAATVDPQRVASNKKTRNEAWKTLLSLGAEEGLRIFRGALADLSRVFGKVSAVPHVLTEAEAETLMTEYLAGETATEGLLARREQHKKLVHHTVAARFDAAGVPEPRNKSGRLRVPKFGKVFCIEGAGYTETSLSEEVVRGLLTDEEWEQVCDVKIIPEQRVTKLSPAKLADLLQDREDLVPGVREAVIPGVPKNPSFTVRDDDKKEDHEY